MYGGQSRSRASRMAARTGSVGMSVIGADSPTMKIVSSTAALPTTALAIGEASISN